jgi:hypothetical protein
MKKLSKSVSGFQNHITLREEATGKIKMKPITNTQSHLRIEHLKKLAVWATADSHIPSLAAFYGHHLATVSEAAGVPRDPSLITCQRFAFLCACINYPRVCFNAIIKFQLLPYSTDTDTTLTR